ncbi:MAG: nicotinic acid mononucleotide adenylyltransferase [Planctomycetales bacterium 12-60-4]|nr:MAG: nicotinic acid mononucleotide adenylyltransferase [Planctomycetales bacterium 12-60-4]
MRIGFFGGTFDPVHLGHLVLAEQCREQAKLDEVWFAPAAMPPHKTRQDITDGLHRLKMLEYAIAGHEHFRVTSIELDRTGPSFTVDTLTVLKEQHAHVDWSLMIGADSLRDFHSWREPERIVEMARIVAVNRGGDPTPDVNSFRSQFGDCVSLVEIPGLQISATDLRARVASGRSIRFLVPRAVEVYIQQQGLYRQS